jgi:DNA polymerase-3 subunit delta'
MASTHPDFIAAGRPEESLELPIDAVREVCRLLALKPARGRYKVAILDDADDLNDAAANCFLKTLEEPPPSSILILIGTSPEQQLPTIVSRCQVIRFPPLPESLVGELLRQHEGEADVELDRLVRLSGGSPGQARALADPDLWKFRQTLLDGLTKAEIDSVGLSEKWVRFVEEAGKESALQRRRGALVVRLLVEFLHDALRMSLGASLRLAEPGDLEFLKKLVNRVSPEQLMGAINGCLEGDYHIDRRVQLVLILEALVDDISQKVQAQ